jgi:riboflavin biosynthesis pyrimidine reductase
VLTTADTPAGELADKADLVRTDGLAGAVRALRERGLGRILCEGGPGLFAALVAEGLVDEVDLTVSPLLAGPGPGRIVAGAGHPPAALALRHVLDEDGMLFLRYAVSRGE